MNLFYCLCGDLLEVDSPEKGSRMLENFMRWEQDGLGWGVVLPTVSTQSTYWMDAV